MILIAESAPGGMDDFLIDEDDITEDFMLHRHWIPKDGYELNEFAENATVGEFMRFSKGIFVKVNDEVEIKSKELIPKTD